MSWDDGPEERVKWDAAGTDGDGVSPPNRGSEEAFFDDLMEHNALDIRAIGFDYVSFDASFDLGRVDEVFTWVKAACLVPA